MADDTGQWGTVSFAIPDFLEDVRDAVNDFAELLVAALEIINVALEFVKAFAKGFLDPIGAILDILIDEITGILRDMRQVGLYLTGDWSLLAWPPEDLRGGFGGYENRMIARLADRKDPTRPELSSKTKVLGFFGYLSADASEYERLLNFITSFTEMFNLNFWPDSSRLPIPTIQDTLYGPDAANVFNFDSLTKTLTTFDSPPQNCRITWITKPASQKNPLNPFPVLGPTGYLVTVSTLPKGIQLRYGRAKGNTDKKDKDGKDGTKVQPREYGAVLDKNGVPIVLHGGAEMLDFNGSDFEFNSNIDTSTGAPEDGACQVFGMLDATSNEVIPLEALGPTTDALGVPGDGRGSEFLLQRTFLIESDVALAQWFAGEYSTVLSLDDMPLEVEWEAGFEGGVAIKAGSQKPATTYYARVFAVGKEIAEGTALPQWHFNATEFRTNVWKSGQPFIIGMKSGNAAIGLPSQPRQLTFVSANTKDYLHALETALLILVLARVDLPTLDEIGQKSKVVAQGYKDGLWAGQQFALKATGLEESRSLLRIMFPSLDEMVKPAQTPGKWRADLHMRVRQLALDIYERTGPMPGAEKSVVESTENLRGVTWADLLDLDQNTSSGEEESPGSQIYKERLTDLGGDPSTPLMTALDPETEGSGDLEFGPAPNIRATYINAAETDELFFQPADEKGDEALFRFRKGEFALWSGGESEIIYESEDTTEVAGLVDSASGALKTIYLKFIDQEGKLKVPTEWRDYIEAMRKRATGRISSSGDMTPVFVSGAIPLAIYRQGESRGDTTWPGLLNLRGLFRAYSNGVLYKEAALVLRVAAAAYTRPPQDGGWIALRLFDTFPELEGFLDALESWVKSLASAIRSVADALVKYIEFIQGMITDLQQLIRRINSMIQSLLAFSFSLPQFSGLMLLSDGTDGLMSDLVTADNKPSDSPLSYGGGVAIVAPLAPTFLFDLIAVLGGEEPDPTALTSVSRPPDTIGIEQIEPTVGGAPGDEPDVL